MSAVSAISSNLIKRTLPLYSSNSIQTKSPFLFLSNGVVSLRKTSPARVISPFDQFPGTTPPEFHPVPNYEPSFQPIVPEFPSLPDIEPPNVPPEINPVDPPPLNPVPNPLPDFPQPPVKPPGPDIPIPPPDTLPPQPWEVPPRPPDVVPPPPEKVPDSGSLFVPSTGRSGNATPGPDFWSWTPPLDGDGSSDGFSGLQPAKESLAFTTLSSPVVEKERTVEFLSIPLESKLNESIHNPLLPPLQSLMAVEKVELSESSLETSSVKEEHDIEVSFSTHAAEAADALHSADKSSSYGVNPDGSRWWKETGTERRPDGVICRWTLTRGVSADQDAEWQEKFWEAADDFGYKELGSEKLGRNATGDVWREYWKESMWQERGLVHLEKTADKWGKNGKGDEWQEKWWEQYNASGKADKWAHKWCSIDPNTPLEAGHAHVWHERWGEKYDGHGGSIKYTDKWAERCEGDAWTKWGDKWDENFDPNGHGVKQGETWWEGKYGERWNSTWGEGHSGSGWVHKYGKSSSGEHWDTHEQQDTWYERFPHFGFYHFFDNSVQLREVKNPSDHESYKKFRAHSYVFEDKCNTLVP